MCGIAGVVYRDRRTPAEATLSAMAATIAHRGPDGAGVKTFAGAGLAHRRLAILDLSEAAAQPLGSPDGSAWIVFNGEIYNFGDLRSELEAKGHTFRSTGDTEVVLAAYREWGREFVDRIDGMFALAIWDQRSRCLLLARDRTGKKPLYLYEDAEKVVFGSEIKAILACPDVDDTLEPSAVPLFLALGYVPTPGTHFRRIRKLPPATRLVLNENLVRDSRRFWDFPVAAAGSVSDGVETSALRIRELFRAAVQRRLVSDVPLGAFLSGGIDSTVVVGVMSELMKTGVRTFSIGFTDAPRHDETAFARLVAERFKTEHVEFKVDSKHFELIENVARSFDEPFGDSSAIPTYVVSKLTREHVTVALTGDGGDELFAGYPRFRKASLMEHVPRSIARAMDAAARRLPVRRHKSFLGEIKRTAARIAATPAARIRSWTGGFSRAELAGALSPELARVSLDDSYDEALDAAAPCDPINRLLYLNARTYLLDDLNPKVDRMAMAASLETRAPFLDTALIDYVFRLPGHYKQRGRTSKWILKEAFRDLLPPEITRRPKKGFSVPLGAWFSGPLADRLEALLDPRARIYPMIDRGFVLGLASEHRRGIRDLGQHFWLLSMLELFLGSRSVAGRGKSSIPAP